MNKTGVKPQDSVDESKLRRDLYERAYERAIQLMEQEWVEAGQTREALDRDKDLASIYDRLLGTDFPKESLYAAWDTKYTDISHLYLRLLSIAERVLDPAEPTFLLLLRRLAEYFIADKNYCAAEPLYARALAIVEKKDGPDHPETIMQRDEYARLLEKLGRTLELTSPIL